MAFSYWTMDIADPDELVTFAVDPAGGANSFFTGYDNPTVVKLSHQAQPSRTRPKRARRSTPASRQLPRKTRSWASSTTRRTPTRTRRKVHGFFVDAARQLPPGGRLARSSDPGRDDGRGAWDVSLGELRRPRGCSQLVPIALGVTILVFFMIHLVPGDPARDDPRHHATPERVALPAPRLGARPAAPCPVRAVHGPARPRQPRPVALLPASAPAASCSSACR